MDHHIQGTGFLILPQHRGGPEICIPTWYTLSLGATGRSPGEQVARFLTRFCAHTVFSHHHDAKCTVTIHDIRDANDVSFATIYTWKKYMTLPLIAI